MSEKVVTIAGNATELSLERDGAQFDVAGHSIELVATRGNEAELRVDGRPFIVPFVASGTDLWFSFDGEIYHADVSDKGARASARHRDHSMSAPMPGIVLKIVVQPGDTVARGKPLLILEAMKMEHQITAPRDGTILSINCKEGELVQPGVELVTMNDEG